MKKFLSLKKLGLLNQETYQKVVYEWNNTRADYPKDRTIVDLFEEQAEKTPDNIAVIYEDRRLSYRELNEKANRLADYLINEYNVGAEDIVAVCLDRSELMQISILGVMKAGAAYAPLGVDYPEERIKYIVGDTKTKVVLTNNRYIDKLQNAVNATVRIESVDNENFHTKVSKRNPVRRASPENLAYIIYTSGTTGKPKGVMSEHRGLTNRILWMNGEYPLCETDRILQKTPYTFDVSVWELTWALLYGAGIVFAKPDGHRDSEYLAELILKEQVTVIHFVPSMLGAFEETVKNNKKLPENCHGLRYLFCSGEALALSHVQEWQRLFPNTQIHNLYGPTEASIDVLYYDCNDRDISKVLIGRPVANTTAYILDEQMRPQPVGAIGELHIGGVQVARGYLNKPELTAEKFIVNPFQTEEEKAQGYNGRIYKTGDLARYLPDGNIEYLGRNDFQVKIRGFRIELGEIESTICGYSGVKQCVVIDRERNGVKYLAAYYVGVVKVDGLREYLGGKLPEYMVPGAYMQLEQLPLNTNGKLDRKALPAPENYGAADEYEAPANEREAELAKIFAEILGLEAEKVSVTGDFFRMGGNSIMAIKLANRIQRDIDLQVKVADVFAHKTVRELLNEFGERGLDVQRPKIVRRDFKRVEDQRLSYAQGRLWFIESFEGGSNAYNIPMIGKLKKSTSIPNITRSLKELVKRHEVLRSVIKSDAAGEGYQEVLEWCETLFEIGEEEYTRKDELETAIQNDCNHIFNMETELPIRANLYKAEEEQYLCVVIHHIAFDGWSQDVFMGELLRLYDYYQNGGEYPLKEIQIQYRDYAAWQREYLDGGVLEEQLEYWKKRLSGYETLNLLTDTERPAQQRYDGGDVHFGFNAETSDAIYGLSRELGVSVHTVMLSAYYLLLSAYSGQKDIVVGTLTASRGYEEIGEAIGFFVNTLVMRQELNWERTVEDYIHDVSTLVIESEKRGEAPFDRVVEALGIEADRSRHPIFQAAFTAVEAWGDGESLFTEIDGELGGRYQIAKFDLQMSIAEGKLISGILNYASSLFKHETIERYAANYQLIVQGLLNSRDKRLGEILLLSCDEQEQILHGWNDTCADYPKDRTIIDLFEEQVEKTPDNIAVIYEDRRLTYRELNEEANRMANYLIKEYKVGAEDIVAVCLDRSELMQISILGIMKAGAAYVPLGVDYPEQRLSYMARDTGTKVILTNKHFTAKLQCAVNETGVNLETVDDDGFWNKVACQSGKNFPRRAEPENLAYLMYTSGTTGIPKGVVLEHCGLMNQISWMNSEYPLLETDRILQKTVYTFDVSVWDLLWAILHGAGIVFVKPNGHLDSEYLAELIEREQATIVQFVPSMLGMFQETLETVPRLAERCRSLRYILCIGEALSLSQVHKCHRLLPWAEVHNLYGPAEATLAATYYPCHDPQIQQVFIGRPMWNTTCYILNERMCPVPIGAAGELCIGGVQVARGYLNKPELTAEKFIVNPFQTEEEKAQGYNGRIYKTGDLARYLPDGNIEYLGRNDFQVKIQGVRIELGEIESALNGYAGVKQCAVVAKERNGVQYLAAYYVGEIEIGKLREYLGGKLPEYMVPGAYMQLEQLPLNTNGKLDRKALPDPENYVADGEYEAPANEREAELAKIFAEILGLEAEKVSVTGDFFRMGGNSIMAIKLANRIQRDIDLQVKVADVFAHKTVRELLNEFGERGLDVQRPKIVRRDFKRVEDQRLSYAQGRLWFIESFEGGSNAYNIPMIGKLKENISVSSVTQSLKELVKRHEVLRSVIKSDAAGEGYQEVLEWCETLFEIGGEEYTRKDELETAILNDCNHIFNMETELPIRANLYKAEEEQYLCVVIHHIAFDGWSQDVFMGELLRLYDYYQNGGEYPLKEIQIQYRDYAAWQREYLDGGVLKEQLEYWKKRLSGYETLNLLTDMERPAQQRYDGGDVHFGFDAETSDAIYGLSRELGVSVHTVMLSAYYLLLSAYSGQKDIVVGTLTASRGYEEIGEAIGFFVNTLVMRQELNWERTVEDYIRDVSTLVIESEKRGEAPFDRVVEALGIEADRSRHPIFQAAFTAVEAWGDGESLFTEIDGEQGGRYQIAKFDLQMSIAEGKQINGILNYASSLFKHETIERYATNYQLIVQGLLSGRDKCLGELSLLNLDEQEQILHGWNDTCADYPKDRTIIDLFEEQVEKTPDNIAVIYEDRRLTYRELNEEANRLANYLINKYSIGAEDIIAVCLDRSELMQISILGIMKAGAAYVPLGVDYPEQRLSYMARDTGTKVILTNKHFTAKLQCAVNETGVNLETVDDEGFWNKVACQSGKNFPRRAEPENLAYLMYTSGTTGVPKGVVLEHRGLMNQISWMNSEYPLLETDRILQKTVYTFDVSVWDLLWAILHGAGIVFVKPDGHLDSEYLAELIEREQATIVQFVPSMLGMFQETLETVPRLAERCRSLRYILCIGEALSLSQVRKCHRLLPWAEVHNLYGPAEATLAATYYPCHDPQIQQVFIGRPMWNTTCYILNERMCPVPIGAAGELCIGGVQVARGYLNKPELTAEKFIVNPFQTEEEKEQGYNGRIYKTGDLARYLPDGNIEYLGRNDFQVKIQGVRIELGEIESALNGYAGVKQCAVVAKERNGVQYLAAYYVGEIEIGKLREYLGGKLPEYMVPGAYMQLEQLPLNTNGKLDRKALPDPDNYVADDEYEAPANERETELAKIFAEILGLEAEKVSVTGDFFRMGGNSIMAIKLANRIQRNIDLQVKVADVFAHKTVRELLNEFGEGRSDVQRPKIVRRDFKRVEDQKLSYAQGRLWFIESFEGGSNAYNIPMIGKLKENISVSSVTRSLRELVKRHEILRSVIKSDVAGEGYQEVLEWHETLFEIGKEEYTRKDELETAILNDCNHIFNMETELPIRANLYKAEEEQYLCIVIHHIAFDGWSQDVFMSELLRLYDYYQNGGEYPLKEIQIQYRDYAAWQREYLDGGVLEEQLEYWKKHLSGYETLNLLTDMERPAQQRYDGGDVHFGFDAETSDAIYGLSRELGVSVHTVMLSAYYLLLSAYSGQKDVVVGTLTASRGYEEIGEAIGFFVNTLVMRQELNWERTVEDYIRDVGTLVIESEKRGEAPFDRVVEALGIEADRSRHPIFQAAFTAVEAWGDGESLFTEIDGEQGGRYQIAKFDLQMRIAEGKLINGILNYASSLFKHETIERYVANYQLIVLGLLNSRDKRLGELSLLSCDELEQVVYQWNDTCADYSKDRTIIDLFEEQVEKTPDNIAVIYEDKRLTYRELNEEANRMANYLINEYNVCADDIVALCLDRSELMIASIFGVLKAGAAYAPMTPDYPEERLAYMVRDTGTKVILVSERHADKLRKVTDGATAHIEIIDTDLFRKKTGKKTCKNPGRRSAPNNLAYVIYTSGTTGVPKGVMIEQHSVINLVQSVHSRFGLSRDETETILFFTDYVFDMSIRQIFLGLLNGHKLVVTVDNSWMNSASLIELMRKESVTVIISTPSLLQQLDFETVDTLRIVNAGGEAVTKEFFDRMSGKHFKFINAYGPTETTVTAVVNAEGKAAHIGRPIDNTVCYILDESMRPVPVGATGELHIGGVGLARGYLNKPELTAEKFVANPFQTAEEKTRGGNSRLYKTGDLARYLQNGNIEYLGRNDFQVKIRGYRIELGDIESALMTYQSVKQCAVLARERGEAKLLLAYYVGEAKEKELRKYLGEKLPDYMIPSAFVRLEQLPLTVSGKLDRRALPDPDISSEAESYICPANERETELAKIFAEVLGLDFEKLSVNGDFFRLGGDSIRSIKLANRIQRQTGFPITIRDIYTHKTVRNLYRNLIAPSVFGVSMQNEQGILTETLPLFPSQQYFFHQMETSGKPVEVFNSYISSTIVEIASVDEKILWQSLVKLTEYHDAFRLKYHKEISGAVIPYYDDYIDIKLHKFDVSGLDERERKAKISGAAGGWMKTLDIFAGNLCAFGLITGCPDEKGQVHLYVHHLNTDGISWRIVGENLKTIYAYLSEHNGDTPVEMILGPKGTSCRQWITALVADNDSAENERAYWENVVQAGMESDKKLRELLGDTVQNNSFAIDKAPTARIMRASRGGLETRIDDILMTALNVALRNLTGMDSHCVAMVSHGRYNFASDIDVSRTMGFFSFPYPLCLPPVGDDITITFNRVKETLRKVPREGTGACSLWLHKNKTPYLPKIFFNYQGEYDDGVRMDIDAADTGNTVSPHDFDIELIGNVYQGKFYFDLNSKLPEEKAVTFVQNFTAALEYVASL